MPEDKGKKNAFQKITLWFKDVVEWVEATFSDPAISREVREDLGMNPDNPANPPVLDPAVKQKIDDFLAKQDIDEAALAQTAAEIKALADTIMTFADAVKADGVSPADIAWLIFKVWVADSLRLRNPAGYALCVLLGLILEDDEVLPQLDLGPVKRLLEGDANEDDAEDFVEGLVAASGALIVFLDQKAHAVGGHIDAMYGWDAEPGTAPDAAAAASRALSVVFNLGGVVNPILTIVPVGRADGGPGLLISSGGHLHVEHEAGSFVYATDVGAHGAFSLFFRFSTSNPAFQTFGPGTPSVDIKVTPKVEEGRPILVFGTSDATRLEIGGFSYGIELGADRAGFKAHLRKGRLVISLGDGDGFLAKLPGGSIDVPFELGLLADTTHGIRFDGGTGLKVDLPVASSLFGVFTVQFLALELRLAAEPSIEIRAGFSLKLGPFQASVDQVGTAIDLSAARQAVNEVSDLVRFLPPRGIGLALDCGPVKGGGYLHMDADKGEYAGALELKFSCFSVKAIALLTTKRPDGSEGWSLLIFVFGQFRVHIGFGIFWTGLGGMIGLHHRADINALTAGMKTGVLDDVLFPANPIANAPRIINRYKQIFPIESDSLLLGPMLELSFSQPPIVYVRLGLIFEIRNALGGDKPAELTKVILLGQLLVQLPPRDLGVSAIVKLLVDIVGFYDATEQFLLIRARLRDSFVGIEGFAKLNLTGELVLAMRFGDDASFVLSAGGFHPAFKDVPTGVPAKLDRMAVSFGIGPIKIRNETYFAVTSNSVQAGCKIELRADISVAAISGHLAFDALLYLTPKFHFIVELSFQVKLEAFGRDISSVTVRMSLEGPGEWRAKGHFGFSILWWDYEIGFDESWGKAPAIAAPTTSAIELLTRELTDPARMLPGPPVGGNALVTLAAAPAGETLAHPLGLITIAQKAVPFDAEIDRIGTKLLSEGKKRFTIDEVKVGRVPVSRKELVTDHFARGQFMPLTEQQKLECRSFETFTSGVRIGTTDFIVAGAGTTVKAEYEVEILEPEPVLNLHWKVISRFREALSAETAMTLATYGAAANSVRARSASLHTDVGRATLREVPLAVVDADTLTQQVSLFQGLVSSEAIAAQAAWASGGLVVEAFEAFQ